MPSVEPPDLAELNAILNSAGALLIATAPNGIVRTYNAAAERLIGWKAAEVVGRQTPMLWHDADEVAARAAELSLELGRAISPDFDVFAAEARDRFGKRRPWTFVRRDGSRVPVQLEVSAIRDETGGINGYVVTAEDVTDRVRAEEERDHLFDLSLDMLAIAGTDGYFKRINPAFTRILGWEREEILARPFLDFVHPDDQSITMREVEKLASGQPTLHFENRYRRKDQTWCWLAWTTTPQPDGTLYATARDVTKLKEIEMALRQSEQNLAITLNAIGDAVLATDHMRRVTRMNPVAEKLTGWMQAAAFGRPIDEVLNIVNEETRQPAVIPVDAVLATGTVHGLANHTMLISRDGTERPIADSAAPIRGDDGNIVGVVLVFRDVTNERGFARRLQQLNTRLEQRVEERTAELAESERRHRTLLANLHGMAYRCRHDTKWTMEFVSEGCRELLGLAPEDLMRDDSSFAALVHPDDLSIVASRSEAGLKSRQAVRHEYRVILPDGRMKWVWEQERGVYRDDGSIAAIEGLITDITERKSAEQALAELGRLNRATLDALSAHLAVLDATGTIVATNQAWKEFAEANDTDWHIVSEGVDYLAACDRAAAGGDADAAAAADAIRKIIAGDQEHWFHEYPCHAPHEERWFYCRVTRFATAGAIHVAVSHENITPMKQAQEQLAASRARYESLAHVSPVGIMLFDIEGKCQEVNLRWSEMTGMSIDEARGDGWRKSIHPDDCGRVIQQWTAALRRGQRFRSEYRLYAADDHTLWVVSQAEEVTNSIGEVAGYVCTLADVNREKQLEQILRFLSTDLVTQSGTQFFETVCTQLAKVVHCEVTAVCRGDSRIRDRVVPLAFCEDGELLTNLSDPAVIETCAKIVDRGTHTCLDGVRQRHPDDSYLLDQRIESYVGVQLVSSQGQPLGCLVAMSRKPLHDPDQIESILKLFSMSIVAEIERQQLASRYSDLFEFSSDAIVLSDQEGTIVQINRQVEKVFGWMREDLIGKSVEVLVPSKMRSVHVALRREYLDDSVPRSMGGGRSNLLAERKDGTVFPVDISLSPMETEKGPLIAAAVRDVSERQHAEDALHDAKVFADSVIESVSGLFYVLDRDGMFVRWNHALQELLALTPEEMRRTSAFSVVHDEDRGLVAERMATAFAEGYAEAEARLPFQDGVRHFLLSGRRLSINGVVYLAGSGADISDRKQAEEEIRSLNRSLTERVSQRTAELVAANSELQKASRAKSEFLATMSHELRTPLNGILGMNELLLTTNLDARQRMYVNVCSSSGKVLLQLINDILDLSKIEAGKLELDVEDCDIEALTFEVVEILSHAAGERGLELNCRVAPEACVIGQCDRNRLRQILVNLIGNAIKFTSVGGVAVNVDLVETRAECSRLRFTVSDTGVGIPAEQHSRLFVAFSQVDSSTTRRFGGTGLGLSICRRLVELMGGEIGVESQVGVGTTFWFEFDTVTKRNSTVAKRKRDALSGTRIIVVDSSEREMRQVAECLQAWRCSLHQVATFNDAFTTLQSEPAPFGTIDVILAACRSLSGVQLDKLQPLASRPNLHIIAVGSSTGEQLRKDLDSLGVTNILSDPVRPSALFDAIFSLSLLANGVAPTASESSPPDSSAVVKLTGHILVAEDNTVNQLYIVELLKHFGCTTDLVENGEQALDAVQRRQYDLVLMDCQMPEMDGFLATREIRKREASGSLRVRTPIVALTANALKGDRERCLDAGMDDYLSKPVESGALHEILAKFLR